MIFIQANHQGNISKLDTVGAEIELNLEFQDLSDITAKRSPYTFSFALPMTHTNNKFFGMYYDVNIALTDFNPTVKTLVEVFDDGLKIIEGYLELSSINISRETYEVVIISTLADAFDRAKGATWAEVINGSLNYVATEANVISSWNTSNDITIAQSGAGNVVYSMADLAKYGVGVYENYPFFSNSNNSYGIFASGLPIEVKNLRPFVRVKYLMQQIFAYAGYSIQGNWINSINSLYCSVGVSKSDLLARPFYRALIGLTSDYTLTTSLTQLALTNESSPNFSDTDGLWTAGYFTAPVAGQYTFQVRLALDFPSASFGTGGAMESSVVFQSQNTYIGINNLTVNYPASAPTTYQVLHAFTETVTLDANESMGVYIAGSQWGSGTLYQPTVISGGLSPSRITLQSYTSTSEVNPVVDIAPNMDEDTIDDWLKGVIQQFNLFFYLDPEFTNVVQIETYDEFVTNFSNTFDWSKKIDYNSDFVVKPTTFLQDKEIVFSQAESNDAPNEAYQRAQNYVFGYHRYSNGNDFTDGIKTIGDYFSPMRLVKRKDVSQNSIPVGEMLFPCAYTEDYKTMKGGPFLAFYHGTKFTDNLLEMYIGGTATSLYPFFSTWSESPITVNTQSTLFGTDGAHDASDNALIGLDNTSLLFSNSYAYYAYWSNLIEESYGENSRFLSVKAILSGEDVAFLKWNDKIFIRDSYWRVLKIHGYKIGHKALCSVDLIKVNTILNDCTLTVGNLNVNGTVGFESGGSPANATQVCCEAYGYIWDSTRDLCFWSSTGGGHGGSGDDGNPHNPTGIDGTSSPDTTPPLPITGITNLQVYNAGTHRTTTGDVQLRVTADNVGSAYLQDAAGQTEWNFPIESILNVTFEGSSIIVDGTHAGQIATEAGYVVASSTGATNRTVYSGQTYHHNAAGGLHPAFQIIYTGGNISFQVASQTGHIIETSYDVRIMHQSLAANENEIVVGARLLGLQDLSGSLLFEDGDAILL